MQKKSTILALTLLAAVSAFNAEAAMSVSYYAPESKLASGHWVKIRVTESGMQQITYGQLKEWGFSDPSKVTVHGHGGVLGFNDILNTSVPDDLATQPTLDTGDRILFYGEANARPAFQYVWEAIKSKPIPVVQRNNVADAGYYFITDSRPASSIAPIPYDYGKVDDMTGEADPEDEDLGVLKYHYCINYFEEELTNPFNAGQLYFGRDLSKSGALSVTFPVDDLYCDVTTVNGETEIKQARIGLRCIVVGAGSFPYFRINYTNQTGESLVDLNLSAPDDFHYFSTNASASKSSYYEDYLNPGTTQFRFAARCKPGSSFTYGALDYMAFYYPRYNRLGANSELLMNWNETASGTRMQLTDVTADTRVWEVAEGGTVIPFETRYNSEKGTLEFMTDRSYTCTNSSGKAFRAIAFNPAAEHHSVQFAEEVANQNLHALEVPDLVILTSEVCAFQAERLAEIHRKYLGHKVLVLRQEEIFNEFSSGTPSLWGIRRLVKMFYDRGNMSATGTKMRSLLLFGGGSYDNRALFSTAQVLRDTGAQLLVFGTPDHDTMSYNTKSYSSDCYFGFCGDSNSPLNYARTKQQVNVGRLSAVDAATAVSAVDKIEAHLKNLPTADIAHRALIITDFGDTDSHLLNGEDVANTLYKYYPGITAIKAYAALYPNQNEGQYIRNYVAHNLKSGVGFFTYSGHGKPDSFSELKVWSTNAIANNEYTFAPFGMLATCDAFTFDRHSNSIAEQFVFKTNGGLIGVIAACRTVYQIPNQALNNEVAKAYAQADENTVTGDIYRIARNEIIDQNYDTQHVDNTMCYNLCGDPALPLYAASSRLKISSINTNEYNSDDEFEVYQRVRNVVQGYIATPDDPSKVDESFNGTVLLTLYEAPVTRTTYVHRTLRPADTQRKIDTDQDAMIQVAAAVTNGRFTVSFTPPTASRSGDYNRITLYAFSSDLKDFAQTYTTSTKIDPTKFPEEMFDTTPPEISAFYINSPEFRSGDTVDGNFTAYATIEPDESGLSSSETAIGATTRMVLDKSQIIPVVGTAVRSNADGSVSIQVPVTSVSDGRHELSISVTDNLGNVASASIEFTSINSPATVKLLTDETVATTRATFDIEHTFAAEPSGRLVVEDADGNTVFTRENCFFPYIWNLRDSNNHAAADGLYSAYVILKSGLQYATSTRIPLVVINRN